MMCEIFDGHLLVLSVRTIEPVALSRRPGLPGVRVLVLRDYGYPVPGYTVVHD